MTVADFDPYKLSSPRIFLVRMVVFIVLAAFVALIIHGEAARAFMSNPALNSVIICVLLIGIALAFRQVLRLFPEIHWVNGFRVSDPGLALRESPTLLAPMASLLGNRLGRAAISTMTLRSILDSVGSRLDEARDVGRYLTGLLVFLGLLGTFWGLLNTVGSVGTVINSLSAGTDAGAIFENLKQGLGAPLGGMGIAFSSSLFGLAGSLILGFLDLQAGQAQNRFYNELEDWLSATVTDPKVDPETGEPLGSAAGLATNAPDIAAALERLGRSLGEGGSNPAATQAMAHLAEGIQGLVQHMRAEQQLLREWVESQADQQREIKHLLGKIAREPVDGDR
jgi:hypothetical protein